MVRVWERLKLTADTQDTSLADNTAALRTHTEGAHINIDSVAESRPVDKGITVPIRQTQNVDDIDTIRKFLGKPRMIAQTAWAGGAIGTPLFGAPFKSFAGIVSNPFFQDKLTGYTGIRYTTNIKVVVNATPFQQGMLRLAYYPNGGNTLAKWNLHTQNFMSISQMPGVTMTTMQKSMEVSVPFLSYQEYYDMTGDRVDPLLFNVFVGSALTNGPNPAKPTVGVTVWVWFTDVELFGASTIVPQSRSVKGKIRTVAAQEERPLSDWLSATSRLAGSLSDIPVISSIAKPTSIWMKYASGVANAFGYSRPVDGQPVRLMAPHYLNSISNADGLNVGSTLALNKDASTRIIDDYSPNGQDEMSVNFIKRQWSFLREFTWSSATANGAQLDQQELGLLVGASPVLNGSFSVTPIEFLGRLARYYRGGVEIMLKFVKTGYHAGSISVAYAVGATTNPLTLAETNVLHRTVVDIQDGDEVCLSFPFISSRDWLPTANYYGRMYVHVVNSLTAPETVAQSIQVQLYVRGMKELEYTGFNSVAWIPRVATPIVNQGGIELQGGQTNTVDDEIVCEPVGDTLVEHPMTGIQAMDCMSENLTSLLSLLKNGVAHCFYFASPDTTQPQYFAFNPSAWTVPGRSGTGVLTDPTYQAGPWSAIRSCYAFQRGGYELNIIPQVLPQVGATGTAANSTYVQADYHSIQAAVFEQNPSNFRIGSQAFPNNAASLSGGVAVQQPRAANHARFGLSATLPYRSLYRVNLIIPSIEGTIYNDTQAMTRFKVACGSADWVLVRPAEDYQLLYWVGVPPMVAP